MAKKKKAPAKRAGSKTPGKKRTASGIGLVSSIACTPAMKNAFQAGSGIEPKYKCNVGYKRLDDAVRAFDGDTGIGLIVTVGGLIAYKAANSDSTKPFVSLVGKFPTDGSAYYKGAVNLQMYTFNPDRIAHLNTKGFQTSQVYLFYNPNSATASDEKAAWTGGPTVEGTTAGNNDAGTYNHAFDSITAQTAAVVMSADPFFYDTKSKLIAAANQWVAAGTKRYICYPLQNYRTGPPSPTGGKATLYGPSLEQAYQYHGKMAKEVLGDPGGP
jgi:hypothetical protein